MPSHHLFLPQGKISYVFPEDKFLIDAASAARRYLYCILSVKDACAATVFLVNENANL